MRIGITGAHSTGKTTLLNALRSEPLFRDLDVCTEVTRDIRKLGLEINEGGTDASQRLIMNQHIVNIFMHENMITDRVSLDGVIYTQWLHDNGKVSIETCNYAEAVFDRTITCYDLLLYTPVEFSIVSDGVRSENYVFQSEIAAKFEKHIRTLRQLPNYLGKPLPEIVTITGTVRERINQAIRAFTDLQVEETPIGQDPF